MVITHEDEECVDVLIPKREDVLNVCIFIHLSRLAIFTLTFIHVLMCVPKVSVLRGETWGRRVREFGTLAWLTLSGGTECTSSSGLCNTSCVVY